MSPATVILLIAGLLVLFGVGQRVLDRMHLNDTQAILLIIAMIAGGYLPEIRLTDRIFLNLGGFVIPACISLYLWFTADSGKERLRSLLAAAASGLTVYLLMHFLPDEPDAMRVDPTYVYGLAAGAVACLFGRSRRGAFIAGSLGMISANIAQDTVNRLNGVSQRLILGGAGAMDAIVLSAFTAVLLTEIVGEALERLSRGRQAPQKVFNHGQIERKDDSTHEP